MPKCAWCSYKGSPVMVEGHVAMEHAEEYLVLRRGLHEIDADIRAAERQAGLPVDEDINSVELDDEDLSDD